MSKSVHALIYCRAGRASVRALKVQEDRCRRKALNLGATETVTIVDRGPADALDRPGVRQMRALVASGRIDLVVVDSPDRLSLEPGDVRALSREVARTGARLVFAVS